MTGTSRPTTARKHTRASKEKTAAADDLGVAIQVNGETYTVRLGDLNSLDNMAMRRETGLTFMGLLQAFETSPDIDLIAAVVWLSRRIDGEQMLSYAEVARTIDYDVEIEVLGEPGEETNPPA